MIIYHYHPVTGEYLGTGRADPSPLEEGVWLVPAHATVLAPPAPGAQQAARWTGTAWELVPDHRGTTAFRIPTGERVEIAELGPLPADVTTTPPPEDKPFTWGGAGWVVDLAALRERLLRRIDMEAGASRVRYITSAPGQDGTYLMKAEQAAAYRAAGYPAEARPWPLIALEAQATGQTPREVADLVLATRDAWTLKAAEIEAARIGAKRKIGAAATVEEMEAAFAAAIAQLHVL